MAQSLMVQKLVPLHIHQVLVKTAVTKALLEAMTSQEVCSRNTIHQHTGTFIDA